MSKTEIEELEPTYTVRYPEAFVFDVLLRIFVGRHYEVKYKIGEYKLESIRYKFFDPQTDLIELLICLENRASEGYEKYLEVALREVLEEAEKELRKEDTDISLELLEVRRYGKSDNCFEVEVAVRYP